MHLKLFGKKQVGIPQTKIQTKGAGRSEINGVVGKKRQQVAAEKSVQQKTTHKTVALKQARNKEQTD